MKKFVFAILFFHITTNFVYATTCVPKTGQVPDRTPTYLQYWSDSYLQCGGHGDPFHICTTNVVVESWDGNLYKCTKNGWKLIELTTENISDCTGNLETIEQNHYGLSNLGTLYANKNINAPTYIYYYDTDEGNGYTAIKNYCKYDYAKFDKELTKCNGDFLHWNDDDTVTLCYTTTSQTNTETTTETKPQKQYKEINCRNTGGDRYDVKNDLCVCNTEIKHLETTKSDEGYSICRCIAGYKRNNENNTASGECIPANDYETKQVPNKEQYRQDAENAYRNEYNNAQSWANKGVTGLSTLMTGEGAKMAAQAFAESRADKKAEEEMADYLAGMRCGYGNGTTLNIGNEDITLPGGNELANYYAEYKTLADKLKTTKTALNLRPGIEAEVLYDRAETGLYQYKIAEIQSGSTPSLSRALMDGESADATAWNAQKTATQNKLITGGVLAATGVVAGYAANQYVNRNHEKKYKDLTMTFTEIKEQIEQKYPEIFTPTTNPVEVVVIEEQPKNLETYAPEKTKVTINQKAKAGAFKSGGVTLTDTGKKGITDAINQYVTAIGEHTDINNIKITAVGHADPQQINSKNITKITNEYKTEMQNSIIPESERILKITKNDDLTKARAQVVISTLIDAIINTALPQNAKQARYDAQGTDGSDCTTTDKTEFEKCRYVDITIEFEGYKKTD